MKRNAILPYNDAFEEYIRKIIEEEKRGAELTGSYEKLSLLEQYHREYLKEKEILNKSMAKDQNQKITTEDVKKFQSELFSLPLSGDEIRKQFQQLDEYVQEQHENSIVHVPVKNEKGIIQLFKKGNKLFEKKRKEWWKDVESYYERPTGSQTDYYNQFGPTW